MNGVNMQSQGGDQYKYKLVYKDHLLNFFSSLRLRAKELKKSRKYYLTFLQCVWCFKGIMAEMLPTKIFGSFAICDLIVHGKLWDFQSQGSVSRGNQDKENMLCTSLEENNFPKWSEELHFVQLMKNSSFYCYQL